MKQESIREFIKKNTILKCSRSPFTMREPITQACLTAELFGDYRREYIDSLREFCLIFDRMIKSNMPHTDRYITTWIYIFKHKNTFMLKDNEDLSKDYTFNTEEELDMILTELKLKNEG